MFQVRPGQLIVGLLVPQDGGAVIGDTWRVYHVQGLEISLKCVDCKAFCKIDAYELRKAIENKQLEAF